MLHNTKYCIYFENKSIPLKKEIHFIQTIKINRFVKKKIQGKRIELK